MRAGLLGLCCLAASTAHAGGLLQDRTTVLLCQETVENTQAAACTLDGPVLDWLKQEGARTVDAAQTERIRRQLAPEQWQNPASLKGVDLVDADLAVVVTTRGSLQMNVGKMKSYLVQVAFRVVDVSRGVVVHASDFSGNGLGLNANAAMLQGCTQLWGQKKAQVRAGLEEALAAPTTQDLWVFDVPDLSTVNIVEQRIKAAAMAADAKQTAFLKGVARWRVQLKPGADAMALARALEDGDSPLVAQGLTGGVLQLVYKPMARVKLPARVTVVNNKGVPAWFARTAQELAEQQLQSTGWIRVLEPKSSEKAVEVKVELNTAGKGFAVKVNAARGGGGTLGAAAETGAEPALPELLQKALDRVVADMRKGLERNPGEYADLKRALAAPATLGAQIVLDDAAGALRALEVDRWGTQGVGRVKLTGAVDELNVRVRVGEGEWKELPGATRTDEVRLVLPVDPVTVRALPRATSLAVQAEVSARLGERLHKFALSRAVMVYPVRAMSWSQPDSYAAFIAPTAPWARSLAVANATPAETLPTPLTARLAATWDALQSRGLRYVPDPNAPFGAADLDLVQLPTETLSTGGGDCDDLVALVATAFEAAGASTVIIKTPRHVLLAVDTGLPFGAWARFVPSDKHAVNREGRLFLPVEATAVGKQFWEAVQQGGARVATERSGVVLVDPRAGWARSAPLEQPGTIDFAEAARKARVRVMVMKFTAPAEAANGARVATHAAATELARNPALEVITEEQVQGLASLARVQMLSGCEGPECVSDLGRALAVRAILTGRVEQSGGKLLLQMSLQDVASMTAEAAPTLTVDTAERLPEAMAATVTSLARTYQETRVPGTAVATRAADGTRKLEELVARDAYARARLLALDGRLPQAREAAALVKEPARRALLLGNIALLEGRLAEAATMFKGANQELARMNTAFAACAAGEATTCSASASGLSPLKVAAAAGIGAVDAPVVASGTPGATESSVRDVARAVMDAAQGRAPPAPSAGDASAVRWLLQW